MLDAAGVVREARFAFGGMAAIVKRAALAEQAVLGRVWNEAAAHAAMAALGEDFQPLSDMRARADYRLRTSRNLLLRFWLETRLDAPLAEAQTRVCASGKGASSRVSSQNRNNRLRAVRSR